MFSRPAFGNYQKNHWHCLMISILQLMLQYFFWEDWSFPFQENSIGSNFLQRATDYLRNSMEKNVDPELLKIIKAKAVLYPDKRKLYANKFVRKIVSYLNYNENGVFAFDKVLGFCLMKRSTSNANRMIYVTLKNFWDLMKNESKPGSLPSVSRRHSARFCRKWRRKKHLNNGIRRTTPWSANRQAVRFGSSIYERNPNAINCFGTRNRLSTTCNKIDRHTLRKPCL